MCYGKGGQCAFDHTKGMLQGSLEEDSPVEKINTFYTLDNDKAEGD